MNDFILLTIIVVLTGVCLVLSDMLARRYCATPGQLIGLALLAEDRAMRKLREKLAEQESKHYD